MTAGLEAIGAGEWIKAQIESNTTLKAYSDVIPEDVDLPAVRFHIQMPKDVCVIDGVRLWSEIDWLVVLVNLGLTLAPLVSLVGEIDAALHKQVGVTADTRVQWCERMAPWNQVLMEATGTQYRHVGGIYRTLSSAL